MNRALFLGLVGITAAACGSGGSSHAGSGSDAGPSPESGGGGGDASNDAAAPLTDGGGTHDGGSPPPGDAQSSGDGSTPPPPAATCTPPIQPVDTSKPTTVVGTGTAASCTAQALSAALAKGGIVTFDCGASPTTIAVTTTIPIPTAMDTTIDGGGTVTLDGGGSARVLMFNSPNYRATNTVVTLQHLTIAHGHATGTAIPTAPAPCSQGTMVDGGGGAIFVRDGVLHVIDVTFDSNQAAPLGPDVGGGAIYANGSLGVVVVGSRFVNGSASNAGGIGCLNSDLSLANDTFSGNHATGNGANSISSMCSVNGGEVGNGGDGAAVCIDGGSDGTATICGCDFENNSGGALGGALFRTPDGAMQQMNIDRTTFDGNTAVTGGGAMYIHNSNLNITASTLSNNSAPGAGAIQSDGTVIAFVNDTFAGNKANMGLGGAMALFGNGGTIQSCTFANDVAPGGSGLFGGAIAGNTALTITDTIFDEDTDMDCGAPMACQDGSSTGQADLQWPQDHVVCSSADTPCAGGGATTFVDPELGMLGANGGPTQTILPQSGSPAIGAGMACPSTDQRGMPRPASGCTIGAVEVQ